MDTTQPTRFLLFQKFSIHVLNAACMVPSYKIEGFFVPEGRILELCSPEDLAAWGARGFARSGDSDAELDRTDEKVEAALRAFRATDWVHKVEHDGKRALEAPAGGVVARVYTGLPEYLW